MKCQTSLPASLLLLWTLTASVSYILGSDIKVTTISDGITLSCSNKEDKVVHIQSNTSIEHGKLSYKDENSGEYKCSSNTGEGGSSTESTIYVKFRSCDNCIQLDLSSVMGIAVGNVVATVLIGVSVYLIASQTQLGPVTSNKKSSDRQHLVPNEVSNRAPNDDYQPLKHKGGQRDMYDVLTNRR